MSVRNRSDSRRQKGVGVYKSRFWRDIVDFDDTADRIMRNEPRAAGFSDGQGRVE